MGKYGLFLFFSRFLLKNAGIPLIIEISIKNGCLFADLLSKFIKRGLRKQ